MIRKLLAFLAFAAISAVAFAQPEIRIQATNLVGVNEQFNITFVISGEDIPSGCEWEPGEDFQLVYGPSRQVSSSTTIVYGKRTKTTQTSYTYILMPKKTGNFSLPAAKITINGKVYTSGIPQIEVVKDDRPAEQQGGGSPETGTIAPDDLFMTLTLSKRSAVVGERLTATLKLYQRVNIAGFENAKFPDFHGFWSQESPARQNIEFQRESVDDKIYNSAVLSSWTIIPQQEGTLTIDPAELVCLVNVRAPSISTGSIFDSFFQDDYRTIRQRVVSEPVSVRVSPLPQGAPASFNGAVGSFSMSAALTRDSLATHEAASLKVSVTGTGNIALLEAPALEFPPDFELYDIKSTDLPSGREFEYPFIPRSHGDFTIGPVEFSYYDVSSRRYVTLKSEPLGIRVVRSGESEPAASAGGAAAVPGVDRRNVKDLGSDIRYIAVTVPAMAASGSFFIGSGAFWLVTVLLFVLAAGAYAAITGLRRRRADVAGLKTRKATKMARKRLAEAGVFLKKNLYTAFYEELHRALLGYVSDKLNLDAAELSKDNIASRLAGAGVPEGTVSEYISLLDACEYARYSPDAGVETMSANYENAVKVISEIDASMGRKHKTAASAGTLAALLLLLFPFAAGAADNTPASDSLWNAGVQHYASGNWDEAVLCWNGILDAGLESEQLYYNLGNAYFKDGDLPNAILNYERALKRNPSYSDARFNLEFANSMIQDNIEAVPDFFLSVWFSSLASAMSSNSWTAAALVALALCLAMAVMFFAGESGGVRKTGFICAIVALIISVACFCFAAGQRAAYFDTDEAIVMSPVSVVKSAPSADSAKDLFVLHEGTKLKVLETVGQWRNIELSDGRQGWMQSSDLELI